MTWLATIVTIFCNRSAKQLWRVIGDCSEPGLIIDAIASGFTVGRTI